MNDTLTDYLNRASKIPLLTPEEEIILGRACQAMIQLLDQKPDGPYTKTERHIIQRGKRAKERMVTANLRLVANITRRFQRLCKGMDITPEDLMQEGTLGLIRGVEKFDPERGYKMSTYIYWWIRQGMSRYIYNHSKLIRVPAHVAEKGMKSGRVIIQLEQQLGRSPTIKEVADALEITESEYRHWLLVGAKVFSLDATAMNDPEKSCIIDLVGDDASAGDHLEDVGNKIDHEILMDAINTVLTDRQRLSILHRYGLAGYEQKTYREISKMLGCHHEACRQQIDRAFRKLRRELTLRKQIERPEPPLYEPWLLNRSSSVA